MAYAIDSDVIVQGQPGHLGYHRNIADVLTGMGAGFSVLNTAFAGGADAAGVADSAAAIQAAVSALPASGGVVRLPPGTYKVASTITVPQAGVYIAPTIPGGTIINFTGTGDCIRMYSTTQYAPGSVLGGGVIGGLIIDGSNAGAGSAGVHAGDIYQLRLDVMTRRFDGAGSKGVWLDNNYFWTEQATGRITAERCTAGVVFDNSANTSGSATGSFDRALLDVLWDGKGKGDGVTFANGAFMVNSRLGIFGNTDYGASLFYVLKLTGSNSGGPSLISRSILNIGVECNATSGTQPGTINFVTGGSNVIERCAGFIDFSGAAAFATANNFSGSFQFDGPAFGDASLMRSTGIGSAPFKAGALTTGSLITTRFLSQISVNPSGNVTGMILQGPGALSVPGPMVTVINLSAFTVTFAAPGTSHVADGTSDVIAANTAASYVWYVDTQLWYRV
jgi:hypothetical protein